MIPQATATMRTFGHPDTLIADYAWWCVLLRPKQPTMGSLVLAAKADVRALSELPREAFAELGDATAAIERGLTAFSAYEKINYLMLMMVDPHPHFHVIPRYGSTRSFAGVEFPDHGWPGPPALDRAVALDEALKSRMIEALRSIWPAPTR